MPDASIADSLIGLFRRVCVRARAHVYVCTCACVCVCVCLSDFVSGEKKRSEEAGGHHDARQLLRGNIPPQTGRGPEQVRGSSQ